MMNTKKYLKKLRRVERIRRKEVERDIRYFCLHGCRPDFDDVRDCPVFTCPLYPHRFPRDPREKILKAK